MPLLSIYKSNFNTKKSIPVYPGINAGFPSPADDHVDLDLDLNEHLIKHPAATFYVYARGNSMINAGIYVMSDHIVERVRKIQRGSLEKDVFQKLPVGALNTFSGNFNFLDIGTPEDYERAQVFFQPFMRRWRRVKL